jgi:heme exporter protein C
MKTRRILLLADLAAMLAALWLSLFAGRIEPAVRNIIYVHVPSSVCSLACFCSLFACSVAYLFSGRSKWDLAAAASAEVGLVFAVSLNLTGSVFSRAEWGVWWTPSPRLVTSAVLVLLYAVYLILRSGLPGPASRRARICAAFGIVGFLDVPMVLISARFMPDIHRADFSFESAWQGAALGLGVIAMLGLAAALVWLRTDLLASRARLEKTLVNR